MTIQGPLSGVDQSGLLDRVEQLRVRIGGRVKLGWRADFTRYGLCRNLGQPITNPIAKIPIDIRPLQVTDYKSLFSAERSDDPAEKLQVAWRRAFVDQGARRGFVAIDRRTDTPCYVQWLFGSGDNEFIKQVGGFPLLKPNEALLEYAYTPPTHRGLGIMSAAMALIALRAADIGANEVITFVDHDNIASLKGCQRAGFEPQQIHRRSRFVFGLITRDQFEPLRDDDPIRKQKF